MKFGGFVLADFLAETNSSQFRLVLLSRKRRHTNAFHKMAASNIPPVVWAQRKDTIYLGIDLQDVKEEKITLESTKLTFKGKSQGKNYEVTIEFFDEVNPSGKVDIAFHLF